MRVRRFGFLFVIAVVVALVMSLAAAFAEAQYGQSPAERLIQGNLQMVQNARYSGGYNQYSPQYAQYGNPYQQQAGYGQQPQRRMGTLERGILGGAIGALGSRMITKNSKVVAGAALGGILIGALTGRQKNPQDQQASYQPQQLASNNMGAEPWPTQQQDSSQFQQSQQQGAVVTVKNCTRFPVEVYDWDRFVGSLQPGESKTFPTASNGGYRGLALISTTVKSWADSRFVDSTGSILFVEPK